MAFAELRGTALITLILIASGLDFLLFGYDQGLMGGILAGPGFIDMLGNPSPTLTGLVTGVYDIGCAFGAVAAFIFGEQIGRKRSIIAANFVGKLCSRLGDYSSANTQLLVIVGAAIQTACYSYGQMVAARIIAGIGVGFSTVAVPILQTETLPAHSRGSMLVVQSGLIIIGVCTASWLCFGCLYAPGSMQ